MATHSKGRACDRKRRHDTREQAEAQRSQLIRDAGASPLTMKVYKCRHCPGWHVGHVVKSPRRNG